MTNDEIIQIAEFTMKYFTGSGVETYEEQDFLDQYYDKYGMGSEEEYVEWLDDQPTFFDEEYNEVG